jgi:hypothetical protein
MYVLTVVVAGGLGLMMVVSPSIVNSLMGVPTDVPIVYGVAGSVFLAFSLLLVLGLRSPLKSVPVLLEQLMYKVVWMVGAVLPALLNDNFPTWAESMVLIFLVFIIGDIVSIPFWTLTEKEMVTQEKTEMVKAV